MSPSLLDTDILSEVLKHKHLVVMQKAATYFQQHQQFTFSTFTRYEILRGLKAKGATTQIQKLATFCQSSLILPITDDILDRAADLWVIADKAGHPKKDADLIIAATALINGLELASGNVSHFSWIPGLIVVDWRQP
jgi:tRNA(fMet)-specific endonuclease VapC